MNKILIALAILVASLVGVVCAQCHRQKDLEAELSLQKNNVSVLQKEQVKYKLSEDVLAVEVEALRLDKKQFKELIAEKDKELAQIRKAKNKEVKVYTNTAITDTFFLPKFDTVYIDADTCLAYNDNYISITQCGGKAHVETHDTITTAVSRLYKHKFLWWKWGDGGYKLDAWSHNPNSNIVFNDFITVH